MGLRVFYRQGAFMKRIIALVIFVVFTAGTSVFAQAPEGRGLEGRDRTERRGQELREPKASEKTTVSGTLGIRQGRIILESGDTFYYVAGINHLTGFIDGLKEGASVSVEGYVFRSPGNNSDQVIRASALTIGGRNYSLVPDTAKDRPEWGHRHRGFSGPDFGPGRMRGMHNTPGWGRPGRRMDWRRH
jgi:hypothetical protein